ncbi:hypothetical protein N185_17070 [Sinorhizobium sp. GW3]|nr:hypothetical protein N185_17070 [Sinorhizobium sp. GW3]
MTVFDGFSFHRRCDTELSDLVEHGSALCQHGVPACPILLPQLNSFGKVLVTTQTIRFSALSMMMLRRHLGGQYALSC